MANESETLLQTQSLTIGELAKALSKAQGEMPPAEKDGKSHFGPYATLGSCIHAAKSVLDKNGLAVVQPTMPIGTQLYVVSTLMHSSGEWIRGYFPVLAKDHQPQSVGSGLSYARRFAYSALISQATGEDDDGELAQAKPGGKMSGPIEGTNAVAGVLSTKQLARLHAIAGASNWNKTAVLDYIGKMGLTSTKELTSLQYDSLCNIMQKFPKDKQPESVGANNV